MRLCAGGHAAGREARGAARDAGQGVALVARVGPLRRVVVRLHGRVVRGEGVLRRAAADHRHARGIPEGVLGVNGALGRLHLVAGAAVALVGHELVLFVYMFMCIYIYIYI